jgi:hypothetical protein
MMASKSMRGYGPCRPVHKTVLHIQQIAIENTGVHAALRAVHQNAFLWTLRVMRGREAQA